MTELRSYGQAIISESPPRVDDADTATIFRLLMIEALRDATSAADKGEAIVWQSVKVYATIEEPGHPDFGARAWNYHFRTIPVTTPVTFGKPLTL
jgi:hypothetical protein